MQFRKYKSFPISEVSDMRIGLLQAGVRRFQIECGTTLYGGWKSP